MLGSTGNVPTNGWPVILVVAMGFIPPYTLVPRFILNLRKLYVRDIRGIYGSDIDTAFGFTSAPDRGAAASTIVFAGGGQNEGPIEGEERGEEIQMEKRDIRSAGDGA